MSSVNFVAYQHLARQGEDLVSCTTSKNQLCISSKQCGLLKKKKLLEMFKTSSSDVKCYANGSRNKAVFQSKFSPTQWIWLANQCHPKSLRYFRVFLAPFRDSKSRTKKGRGGEAPFYICLRKTLDSAWLHICGRIITGKCLICVFATQKDIRGGWNH